MEDTQIVEESNYEGDYTKDEGNDGVTFKDYDIVSSPNDFNILTIFNFIQSGVVEIPAFQRNYVWDIKRASKLIESILIGLPIPQVFLYEEDRNKFLLIDGQQRLMTVYYFIKKRFPRKDKRVELRRIFAEYGSVPESTLADKRYFIDFDLELPSIVPNEKNRFDGLNYETLEESKSVFELRTIRNIIVKQTLPKENDDSSKYEIFNRLNSGGVNLTPQEIRASIYHSPFYNMLYRINMSPNWRKILGKEEADLHMKDIEILLRGFGMLIMNKSYSSPMTKFLNQFSSEAKKYDAPTVAYLETLFNAFTNLTAELSSEAFLSKSGKINISIFEAIFAALCDDAYQKRSLEIKPIIMERVNQLKSDPEFVKATVEGVAATAKVTTRIQRAKAIL